MTEASPTASNLQNLTRKLALVFIAIVLFLVLLLGALSFMLSTQTGSQWALSRAVDNFNGSDGLTLEVENVQGTIFRGLSFGRVQIVVESAEIAIRDLRTSWNPYSLLTGQLLLSDLWMSSLRVEVQENEKNSETKSSGFDYPLPFGITLSTLRVEKLEVVQQEQVTVARSITLGAELDDAGLELTGLEVSTQGLEFSGELDISFTEALDISGRLAWRYDLSFNDRVEQLVGRLELNGDISRLVVEHQLESPQRIRSNGSIVSGVDGSGFSFDLNHSADTLTLPVEVPARYALNDISLRTEGSLESVSLGMQLNLQYEQLPIFRIESQADYSDSKLNILSYNLSEGSNSISGDAIINWATVPSVEGSYALELQSIGSFIDLPASIELNDLTGAGNYDLDFSEEGVEGRFDVEAFEGQLAAYPLAAQGSLYFKQGVLEIDGLELLTQNNQLRLDGSYAETMNLSWSLSAESLDEFLLGSSGVLEGQGSVQGNPRAPDLTGSLSGRNLSYQQFNADQLEFAFASLGGQIESQLLIDAFGYTMENTVETLSKIELLVSGTEAGHSIALSAMSRYGALTLDSSGGISDLQNIVWQGMLESAYIDTPVGTWSTRSSAAMSFSANELIVGESCWTQAAATVCFELQRSAENDIAASGSVQSYPLSIFNSGQLLNVGASASLIRDELLLLPQLPQGSSITGSADGQFTMNQNAGEDLLFSFQLVANDALLQVIPEQVEPAESFNEDLEPQKYNLEVLGLTGDLQAGDWQLSGEAGILRENLDDSDIDVRGEISAAVNIAADSSLGGTVEAGLADLRWLQAIVPELSAIGGSLNAKANLGGSISDPEATGSIDLEEASVSIAALEITLEHITANVSSTDPRTIQITGQAQSDAGSVEFNGEISGPFGDVPTLSAEVVGEDFQLANIPNLELTVSPNVTLNADADSIEVIGSLDVPILNLTLEELPETAIDVSRDAVIVSYPNDRPDLARSITATETTAFDRPLAGSIDITLGENVGFTGFGMTSKLAGNLDIQQTIGGSNRTYGELTIVEGSYEMYRQSLDISQGKLLFFGAYDNPGIDLKATRKVENYTVGVLMNGTLKNINSQLFSTPALANNDIISVLVTGRPFSEIGQQEGDGDAVLTAIAKLGVGRSEGLTNQVRNKLGLDVLTVDPTNDINNSVLTIGKYITPDIFIRYGVGLFDNQSKVAVDYALSERLKLQAESGEYQSVDVIYSVER